MRYAFLFCCLLLIGCSSFRSGCKNIQSDTIALERRVILYDCSGDVIREWKGKMRVGCVGEGGESYIDFQGENGLKRIVLGGTYVIEEL